MRKHDLMEIEDRKSGRVHLSEFYRSALYHGKWYLGETTNYLRHLGALDDTEPRDLLVIIPNYVTAPSNCVDVSKHYSVCCRSECDAVMGRLESELGAPSAAPSEIAGVVAALPTETVPANR